MDNINILTVVGARPQFIKAATVSRAIAEYNDTRIGPFINERIVHTGQHFDENMSEIFFRELHIPVPDENLGISGGPHGEMTGRMTERIEKVLIRDAPDWVLVYGDTNSTLAAALAARKMNIPVAHVEAGLRSFNRTMPEEINRLLSDQVSTLLFCPTESAVANLQAEGFPNRIDSGTKQEIVQSGDVMVDSIRYHDSLVGDRRSICSRLGIEGIDYILATIHRAENTDDAERLKAIVEMIRDVSVEVPVVLPLHPRTRKKFEDFRLVLPSKENIIVTEPIGYLDMISLEKNATVIVTDSGGIQKEAFFFRVPCVTLRDQTEWRESVELGWNQLVSPGDSDIQLGSVVRKAIGTKGAKGEPYGHGDAAPRIVEKLLQRTFEDRNPGN